jgi:hypothetical protein
MQITASTTAATMKIARSRIFNQNRILNRNTILKWKYKGGMSMSYESHSAGRAGETFIFPDGTQRVLAHVYFAQAKLMDNATLLKLYYSFCVIEISGERLNIIFDDITSGRMGVISKDADNAVKPATEPIITNIIYLSNAQDDEEK